MGENVTANRTPAEIGLAEAFAQLDGKLPGNSDVKAKREEAFARFGSVGLPHRRVEAWHYTDLKSLQREALPLAAPPSAEAKTAAWNAQTLFAGLGARRLVIIDGTVVPALSDMDGLEPGLTVSTMAAALSEGDPFVASHLGTGRPVDDPAVELNTAFMGDGVVIRVAEGAVIERPIHLVFVATGDVPASTFVRSLVVVGNGAKLTLAESHQALGAAAYQPNIGLELVVGDDAQVDYVKCLRESTASQHLASFMTALGARAVFNHFSLTTGGAVVRNQLFLKLNGEGACVDIRGANLLRGNQHADTTLVADHLAPGCQAREVFKSVLADESRGIFQGKISVAPDAQKTDAKMMAQALLLSETAEFDSKPELEIFADDVQCGHGTTAGALDEDLRFYLMARGIPADEAESLLIQAFVGETLENIAHESLKSVLMSAVADWLQAGGASHA
ncbi:Fe-S cluster assembly protein SufD [Methyloceanibacter methanicus]|uniref:Fe-S cluster assembly protein SufD n=1 Tax=Methyloceanibacter methanicus TaxID=1774968 RepID=A0A1E3VWJ9_9HYPH|nr:Fe-S cluster assembly protein SufD [Methyloceanibacter methanicus]ODR97913.1 Fe-S cluster assembly protein SufD [Methyloceanibacter methanicus]